MQPISLAAVAVDECMFVIVCSTGFAIRSDQTRHWEHKMIEVRSFAFPSELLFHPELRRKRWTNRGKKDCKEADEHGEIDRREADEQRGNYREVHEQGGNRS